MSTTIDEKIVSMKFDNSNFEKNVKTSMSTLDKLKAKLNFKGASDSLEDLSKASDKLNFKETQNGLERVSVQFNAMYAIATRVFERLTDQAIRMVKAMSIDQVTAGMDKYTKETEAVQTIMAATGKDIETVSKELEKITWFTDETSYNFTDMVDNIGKFTSAGIDLKVAVSAMQGIANWAALSGAGIQSASRAMYNLSQSIGMGYLTLMDWKSIELANMATMSFKDQLLQTAEAMEAIVAQGENAEGVMEYLIKGSDQIVTNRNLRETLNEKWVTNDILMAVLNEYGAYASAIQMVQERYAELDKEVTASETMRMVDQFIRQNEIEDSANGISRLAEEFHLTDLEAKGLLDTYHSMGRAAFAAAQEAKTWNDVINATGDAVSSQWMTIFRTIFGDYQEAKLLFTDMANEMWNVFAGPISGLSEEISKAFNHKSEWYDFMDSLDEAGYSADKFQEAMLKVAGKETIGEYKGVNYTLEEMIEKFGSLEKVSEHGYISFSLLTETLYSLGTSVTELGDGANGFFKIIQKGGRIKLIESIAKTYNYLKEVISTIGASWQSAFPISISERITKFIDKFYDLASGLELTDDKAAAISRTFDSLFSVFRSAGSILSTIIGGIYSIAKSVLPYIISAFAEITNHIIPLIQNIAYGIEQVVNYFKDNISGWLDAVANSKTVSTLKGYLQQIKDFFIRTIDDITNKVGNVNAKKIFGYFDELTTSILDFAGSILSSNTVKGAVGFISDIFKSIAEVIKSIRLPSLEEISAGITQFFEAFKTKQNIMDAVSGVSAFSDIFEVIKAVFSKNINAAKYNIVSFFTDAYANGGSFISKALKWAGGFIHNVASFVSSIVGISIKSIYTAVRHILALAEMFAVFKTLMSLSGLMDALKSKLRGESGGPGSFFEGLASFIKAVGIVAAEMVALAIVMGELNKKDPDKLNAGFAHLADVIIALGVLIAVAMLVAHGLDEGSIKGTAAVIIALGVAFAFIADSLKKIETLKINPEGLVAFALALGMLFGFVWGLTKLKGSASGVWALVALAYGMNSMLEVISKYNNFDWAGNAKGLIALIPMLIALVLVVRSLKDTGGLSAIAFVGMAVSLKLLVNIIEDLGSMPPAVVARGELALIGLLTMMTVFALLLKTISLLGNKAGSGINVTLGTFIGIVITLAALCLAISVLGQMDIISLAKGVGAVAILMAGIIGMLLAIGKVGKVSGPKIILALVGLIAIMAAISLLYKEILSTADYSHAGEALTVLGVMILELGLLGGLAYAANELGKVVNFGGLTKGLVAIGEVMAFVALTIAVIEAIMVLVSKVVSEETLEKTKNVAVLLGEIIGGFVGGVLGGIMGGALAATASFLPYIGEQLSLFGEKISGFLDFINSAKSEDSSNMSNFMSSMGEMIKSLAELTKYKGKLDTIPDVGTKMREFMENLTQDNSFFNGLDAVKDDQVKAAKVIAEIMQALAPLASEGGLASIVVGKKNIAKVGTDLTEFGGSLCKFVSVIQNGYAGGDPLPDNAPELVENFAKTAGTLIDLFEKVPEDGGKVVSFISGTKKWNTVGDGLYYFAYTICQFADYISDNSAYINEDSSARVKTFMKIAKHVIEGFESLPDEGGLVERLFGEKDWSSITTGLDSFGESIVSFIEYVNGLDDNTDYTGAIEKVKYMLNLARIIAETSQLESDSVNSSLVSMIGQYVTTISTSIMANSDRLRQAGGLIGVYIKDGFNTKIADTVNDICSVLLQKFSNQFVARSKTLRDIGINAVVKISDGIKAENPSLYAAVDELNNNLVEIITYGQNGSVSLYDRFYYAGEQAASGLANGINNYSSRSKVWNAARSLGNHAVDALNYSLSINSPSRVFMKAGQYSAEGYTLGITNSLGSVSKATTEMGNRSIAGMNSAISRIGDAISTDSFQNQPVIRPVLDLSDVNSGADQMRGILGDNYNLALSGSVTSRRLSNSIEIQNRGSAMADAIASLKDDFRSMTDEIMGMRIVMDSGALVGSVAPKMDKALGTISTYKGRGNTY